MNYRITITRVEQNPNYKEKESYYGGPREMPNIETEALRCELTDEQFDAVRKACLEVVR